MEYVMLHPRRFSRHLIAQIIASFFVVVAPVTGAIGQHADDVHWDNRFGGSNGLDGGVNTIKGDGQDIYVGGGFWYAGGIYSPGVARWDGLQWHSLSSEIDGFVADIAITGGDVYACGSFTSISNTPANHVARWDGNQWYPLGAGTARTLYALSVLDGELYAGGFDGLFRWDGVAWHTVATLKPSDRIHSIFPYGADLYVAGNFSTINGVSIVDFARWNGSSWAALGNPLGNACMSQVIDVYASETGVFVCGEFLSELGVPESLRNVAVWDGSEWDALGLGVHRTETYPCDEAWANAVTEVDGKQVFGGWWETAGGQPMPYLARWDGSGWTSVGSGVNNVVTALLGHNGKLYVGGSFTIAGGKLSNRFAIYDPALVTAVKSPSASGLELGQNIPNPFNPETAIPYTLRQDADIILEVLNVEGRLVHTLVNQRMPAGNYVARWNGRDDRGRTVASGVYFFRLSDGVHSLTQKAVLVK